MQLVRRISLGRARATDRTCRLALLAVLMLLGGGCGIGDDPARREYFQALELSKTGMPVADQLRHADRAVQLAPQAANYLELRARLLFGLQRLPEARADYDAAVQFGDRPYLRFERADLLCAMGELSAALDDLDVAVAAQPDNVQFYPRRALARLAAGRIADAQADIDEALRRAGERAGVGYAQAALWLVAGKPQQAIDALGPSGADGQDYTHAAMPHTLRMLALIALGDRAAALGEFDADRLHAASAYPELGYAYWLTARGCSNAFVASGAAELVAQAHALR